MVTENLEMPMTSASFTVDSPGTPLPPLRNHRPTSVAVVGAGPGGLTAAIAFSEQGMRVTVYERRANPFTAPIEDHRSFNITLGEMGLAASGTLEPKILAAGQRIYGRAIHQSGGTTYVPYGLRTSDGFTSIPRLELTKLQIQHAAELGVEFHFEQEVIDVDTQTGRVEWRPVAADTIKSRTFGLVVFADGINGCGRSKSAALPGASYSKVVDLVEYYKADMSAEEASGSGLPKDQISFWPGTGGPTIGIPNKDGSMHLLVMFDDKHAPRSPFTKEEMAREFLKKRNPSLLDVAPGLPTALLSCRRGHFYSTTTTDWVIGAKAVLVGDAARCAPPYSGAGAAAAMSDAAALAQFVRESADLPTALAEYQEQRRVASKILQEMISAHGHFLTARLGSWRWRVGSWLQLNAEKYLGSRDLYQTIVFERDGLNRLARTETMVPVPAYLSPFCM